MSAARAPEPSDVFAVVRLDSHRNYTPRPENVTIRKVVRDLTDAELEVRHLNALAPTGTVYFVQRTVIASPGAAKVSRSKVIGEVLAPLGRSRRKSPTRGAKSNRRMNGDGAA